MQQAQPGACMDHARYIPDIDFSPYNMKVSTERFTSRDYHGLEREMLWMRVWQVAGREDELREPGDWKVYQILDQSYVVVRGKDGIIRGFVNTCRHRANAFCAGQGHSVRFTCPYHKWTWDLDGQLVGVAKPDFKGTLEEFVAPKEELGLLSVQVECFAGFVFLNPDLSAPPLTDFLGPAKNVLAAYRLEEMIPVGLNVREKIKCNWKVVIDAFQEGYHVQGVHPELISYMDMGKERFMEFGNHCACTVPFGGAQGVDAGPEQDVAVYKGLPLANFPGIAEALPRFDELIAPYRDGGGVLSFPEDVSARGLMQRAVRDTFMAKGLDVSGLTDAQMSDYQFWALFPNVYMQLCPGEATVIIAEPDQDGDPGSCAWHVTHYLWLPSDQREGQRTELVEIPEGEHFDYFLALEQDYAQMQNQQKGLKNRAVEYMVLTKQEPRVAHFHSVLDSWISGNRWC